MKRNNFANREVRNLVNNKSKEVDTEVGRKRTQFDVDGNKEETVEGNNTATRKDTDGDAARNQPAADTDINKFRDRERAAKDIQNVQAINQQQLQEVSDNMRSVNEEIEIDGIDEISTGGGPDSTEGILNNGTTCMNLEEGTIHRDTSQYLNSSYKTVSSFTKGHTLGASHENPANKVINGM